MNELYHWGIIGQKWGVRRYQNEDGTYTPAGKERYNKKSDFERYKEENRRKEEKASKSKEENVWLKQQKRGKDKPPVSPAETVANKTREGVDAAQDISRTFSKLEKGKKNESIRAQNEKDLSEMSDDEIRAKINRMNLERQYNDLTTRDTSSGFDTVSDILGVAKDVVVIVGGALTIAATYQTLKNGGK